MKTVRHNATTSTNDSARRLAALNPGMPLLVSAEEQTAGRGRAGRDWQSPVGGAWFSLAVPVDEPRPTAPLTVGLAVRRVVSVLAGGHDEAKIKWPNDVLLCGRKIAGILCEQVLPTSNSLSPRERAGVRGHPVTAWTTDMPQTQTDHTYPHPLPEGAGTRDSTTLIVGVGINVNNPVDDLPELRHPATSLAKTLGHSLDVNRLIDHTAQTILDYLRRPFIADDIRPHLAWRGQTVCVTLHQHEHRGTLAGIDRQGRLLLETDSQTLILDAGDVRRVRLDQMTHRARTEPSDPMLVTDSGVFSP